MNERVLLIRHGQTDWNAQFRWQGSQDVPLNTMGRRQALALADHLRGRKVSRIYASDLSRAYETAQIIGAAVRVPVVQHVGLRELNAGKFEGLTRDEMMAKFGAEYDRSRADYFGYVFPDGESRGQLQTRMMDAFKTITAEPADNGGDTLIVTHGGSIAVLLQKLFPHDKDVRATHIENTSYTVLRRDGHRWHLDGISLTPHLVGF